MKPAAFAYARPDTLAGALAALAEHGGDAKPLAGGQSLVPTMNFRLAAPSVLVDLNRIDELAFLRADVGEEGELRIGAMTRQRDAELDDRAARACPLLAEALGFVGHPQIRNRGTVGGSLAHADPAAELPAVLLAAGGRCRLAGPDGDRWVAADDFYDGVFGTARRPDELLVEVALPAAGPRSGAAFEETARRDGDFALAGVAVRLALDGAGRCAEVGIGLAGLGPCPVRAAGAEALLAGEAPTDDALEAAARKLAEECDPPGDMHASTDYRRRLARALAERALARAAARASDGEGTAG